MREVVKGQPNKQIAAKLRISEFTVKIHRRHRQFDFSCLCVILLPTVFANLMLF